VIDVFLEFPSCTSLPCREIGLKFTIDPYPIPLPPKTTQRPESDQKGRSREEGYEMRNGMFSWAFIASDDDLQSRQSISLDRPLQPTPTNPTPRHKIRERGCEKGGLMMYILPLLHPTSSCWMVMRE
jgi:hypothetical protein